MLHREQIENLSVLADLLYDSIDNCKIISDNLDGEFVVSVMEPEDGGLRDQHITRRSAALENHLVVIGAWRRCFDTSGGTVAGGWHLSYLATG